MKRIATWKQGKCYRIIPDSKANQVGCWRVIDESGEDYLDPQSHFVRISLRPETQALLLAVEKN